VEKEFFFNKNKQAHYNQDDDYAPEEYSSDSSEIADEFIGLVCKKQFQKH
jgi:hypothetical protein